MSRCVEGDYLKAVSLVADEERVDFIQLLVITGVESGCRPFTIGVYDPVSGRSWPRFFDSPAEAESWLKAYISADRHLRSRGRGIEIDVGCGQVNWDRWLRKVSLPYALSLKGGLRLAATRLREDGFHNYHSRSPFARARWMRSAAGVLGALQRIARAKLEDRDISAMRNKGEEA